MESEAVPSLSLLVPSILSIDCPIQALICIVFLDHPSTSPSERDFFHSEGFLLLYQSESIPHPHNMSTYVKVLYSYESQQEGELTINLNDVIHVVSQHESGWWTGELNGKKGIFPGNYVETLSAEEWPTATTNQSSTNTNNSNNNSTTTTPTKSKIKNNSRKNSTNQLTPSSPTNGTATAPVSTTPATTPTRRGTVTVLPASQLEELLKAKVHTSYTAKDSTQLSLALGDVVYVMEQFPTGIYIYVLIYILLDTL